ncbi:hypothetical protein C7M84_001849 [Penaeus vannamei]|uniref:Uncharacterized protein n=1 Tax=Penaeus vannamei TaxID=6689 RepID=A0A3R7PQF7_PENVA|nr:hypothetical protein C7M84_001849 [Penaeus vannamei]
MSASHPTRSARRQALLPAKNYPESEPRRPASPRASRRSAGEQDTSPSCESTCVHCFSPVCSFSCLLSSVSSSLSPFSLDLVVILPHQLASIPLPDPVPRTLHATAAAALCQGARGAAVSGTFKHHTSAADMDSISGKNKLPSLGAKSVRISLRFRNSRMWREVVDFYFSATEGGGGASVSSPLHPGNVLGVFARDPPWIPFSAAGTGSRFLASGSAGPLLFPATAPPSVGQGRLLLDWRGLSNDAASGPLASEAEVPCTACEAGAGGVEASVSNRCRLACLAAIVFTRPRPRAPLSPLYIPPPRVLARLLFLLPCAHIPRASRPSSSLPLLPIALPHSCTLSQGTERMGARSAVSFLLADTPGDPKRTPRAAAICCTAAPATACANPQSAWSVGGHGRL